MKELSLLVSFVGWWLTSASLAYAQEAEVPAPAEDAQSASMESAKGCFPACRHGYVCHPDTQACVSLCNPPCADWEACSDAAECVAQSEATAKPGGENGDRRFRFVVLGRFGFGGTSRVNLTEPLDFTDVTTIEGKPGATLGFDLRFEKPVSKYVTVGGLISNYWLRPQRSSNSFVDLRAIDPNEYALDISPFVKPRYPFRAGSREAELYLFVYVGGSLLMHDYFTDLSLNPITTARGGFNFGVGPGFQVFVTRSVALVFEVGYAYSWFKLSDDFVKSSRVGQATLRFGFAFAF